MLNEVDLSQMVQLVKVINKISKEGHTPATGGNFSLRTASGSSYIISKSGVDKTVFGIEDLILIDKEGNILPDYQGEGIKTSDETLLHSMIYEETGAGCVLHTHILEGLLCAEKLNDGPEFIMENLELLKAFSDQSTHKVKIITPIFENHQDMEKLKSEIAPKIKGSSIYGFILKGHGLYVWGKDVTECHRHLDAYTYLFKYYWNMRN
jgi:methylthioribulose-1-phosphate dehydratase